MQAVIESTGLNPAEVGDIVIGTVLAPGAQRANECRMAAFFAGFPGELLTSVSYEFEHYFNLWRIARVILTFPFVTFMLIAIVLVSFCM